MNLSSINGLGKTSLELLDAAGYRDLDSVANAAADELFGELGRANDVLKIARRAPGRSAVGSWIDQAQKLVREAGAVTGETAGDAEPGPESESNPEPQAVNFERSPDIVSMLAVAPFALPLPARLLVENQLGVSDIPAGILLNHVTGDLEVNVDRRPPRSREARAPGITGSGYVRLADQNSPRLEIDTSRIRSTDEMGDPMLKVAAVKISPANDRIALLRAPRSSTNEGRDPRSRRYIRGVLHSHPFSITAGALVTLLLMLTVPLSVISATLLLLSAQKPETFAWVPGWLLAVPLALPLLGIGYLIWGIGGSCRICGQKLFLHRSHLKNSKAHRVPGLGYILPLCVHILAFRWFRCTHCGTPVRLKE